MIDSAAVSAPLAQRRRRATRAALLSLLATAIVFGLYQVGSWPESEVFTPEMARAHPERVPGWFWQRDDRDDPRLYFELSGQLLGRPYDRAFLEYKRGRAELQFASEIVRPAGPMRPYAEVRCEYPPLALALFLPPRLLTDDARAYARLFSVEMGLILLGIGLLAFRLRARIAPDGDAALDAARLFAPAVLLLGMTQVLRFDAAPALATGGALLSLLAGAPGLAGALLGCGVALKLWPLLVGPVFLLALLLDGDRRGAARLVLAGAAAVALAHAPALALAGRQAFDYLGYQGERGLHTESFLGNVLVLLSKVTPVGVWTRFENGSDALHAAGVLDRAFLLTHVAVPLAIGAALVAAARGVRRTAPGTAARGTVLAAAVVSLVAGVLVASKVLSPQYLVWLAPAVLALPGAEGLRLARLYLFACLLTQIFYPRAYSLISDLTLLGHIILFMRNVTLLIISIRAARLAMGPISAHA